MMRNRAFKIISILAVLALMIGASPCGSKESSAGTNSAGTNAAGTNSTTANTTGANPAVAAKLPNVGTLKVAWFPATIKAALTTIAFSEGYFEEEGVRVQCETIQNAADALTALKLGKVDVVPVGISQPVKFISEGTEFSIIGGSAQEGGAIITKPENAEFYKNLDNWRGKNWASGRNYTGDFIVRNSLRQKGIVPGKDITITDLADDTAIIQAISKGLADVAYITADGVSRAKSMGLSIIIRVGDLDPYYPCCRQTANTKAIESNKAAYVAYQRGLIRAYKLIQSDHEKTIAVMQKLTGQSRDYVETGLYGEFASRYNPSPATKKVADFTRFLKQEGVVTVSDFKIEDHVNSAIFKEALSDILKRYPNDKDYLALKEFSDTND